ncbi:MAG: helix-turn-helix domain-containing protein [Dermatophilaceae bacterium]
MEIFGTKAAGALRTGPRPGYGPLPKAQVRHRRAHLSPARATILDVLIDQPEPCTVAALSALTRQHPNTIREHLDGLSDARLVIRVRAAAQGRGRPPWLYSAAPEASAEPGSREYAGLAAALAGHIARTSRQPRSEAIEAGREWGRALVRPSQDGVTVGPKAAKARSAVAARRQLVNLLEELGFAPDADAHVRVVKLRHCPLLEAAHKQPEVVCGVHLGIARGALQELGNNPDHTENIALQPFSEPGACRLDLLPRISSR